MPSTAIEETPRVTTPAALMTAEEMLAYDVPNTRVELVRGRLVVRDAPGVRHGEHAARMVFALMSHLARGRESAGSERTDGRVVTCDTGFILARGPDTVRCPDVAYVSRERMPGVSPDGYGEFAPDIVVEIRSPSDRAGAVLAKVVDYLDAGSRLVWVVDPARQQVTVYREDGSQAILGNTDVLDGGEVLVGFTYSLSALFAD